MRYDNPTMTTLYEPADLAARVEAALREDGTLEVHYLPVPATGAVHLDLAVFRRGSDGQIVEGQRVIPVGGCLVPRSAIPAPPQGWVAVQAR